MSRARRRPVLVWVLAVLGAFALGALVSWILAMSAGGGGTGTAGGTVADPDMSFAISGDLTEPVAPGILVPLDLSLTNSQGESLLVSGLTIRVTAVDAPNATASLPCTTDDFVVEQLDSATQVVLDAGATRTLTELGIPRAELPRVGMADAESNQDGCKAASLELGYTATGRAEP